MKIMSKRIAVVLIAVLCMTYLAGCQVNTVGTNPEEPINQEEKNKFYVYQMEVSDPKYTTPRLVKVGDSLDKLKDPVDHFDAMGFTVADNKIGKIKIYTLLE
jgi:hypothetical protein